MESVTDRGLSENDASEEVIKKCRARAKAALASLKKNNPRAHAMVMDPSPHIAGRCPRRAGKTYSVVTAALATGESKPGAVTLIISLNLKQVKRLYWKGAAGINALARKYGIKLKTNENELSWTHENGSMGYLLGCDDDDQLEVIRGLEADLYIIDECKSFAPNRLETLITDILVPQRASRRGRIMLIGTPGHIFAGPFYQATCLRAVNDKGQPYCLPHGQTDPWGRTTMPTLESEEKARLWSLHTWTLEDNSAMRHQWDEALITKAAMGWADDHPTWCREYLGEWTSSSDGLVYRYAAEKSRGRVTWAPERTPENPAGLPKEGAPWRFIAGLDIGYEAPTAFVLMAYSTVLGELRHVRDWSEKHMLVHDLAALIQRAAEEYGPIEKIFADKGNLGKMVVETLIRDYGFNIEAADKREKFDHIELVNGAFSRGEVKILPNTTLEYQLLTNAWDLEEGTREELGRLGRLKEDRNIPNDSTDAFIYCYRGSLHYFRSARPAANPIRGTVEWEQQRRRQELETARARARKEHAMQVGHDTHFRAAPSFVKAVLGTSWQNSRYRTPKPFTRS